MAGESKLARIEWGHENKKCPYCGIDLTGKKIIGSGQSVDGKFCSLDCFARFHYGEPKKPDVTNGQNSE